MTSKNKLQKKLSEIPNVKKVYVQAPKNTRMEYPCIRLTLNKKPIKYADNIPYMRSNSYMVTIIDTNINSEIPNHVESFSTASFVNFYVADNLNHWVYTIYI